MAGRLQVSPACRCVRRSDEIGARTRAHWSGGILALASIFVLLTGCLGGPHPLPPGSESASTAPMTSRGPAAASTPMFGDGANNPATLQPGTPTGAAGAPGSVPPPASAAGSAAPTTGQQPPATTPPPANAPSTPTMPGAGAMMGSAGAGGTASEGPAVCDGPTSALSASETAPSTLLFILDRSIDMSSDWAGAPRWQRSADALKHVLAPRANELTLGAMLYPSATATGRTCTGPDWLCGRPAPAICEVSPMAAADQVSFQPASQALDTLLGTGGLYTPVMADGVPLVESLDRADVALSAQPLSGRTSVVILASGMPSCAWDSARASATLERWRTTRGVQTFVVALPGTAGATSDVLSSLAAAGGTGTVRMPQSTGALEATLQSIVFDSLSSCSLELDPPATDPNAVSVLVTQGGVERNLPRTSATGETLWTISADGSNVMLLGSACDAARGGTYEALRIVLGCARP